MRDISILIKPSSNLCNIKCNYCFYNKIAEEREIESYGFMSLETLENIVKKALEESEGKSCIFGFQGGEPTLVGLKFFEKFIEFTHKYNKGTKINYLIQTNGINLDKDWAKFLKKNNFLVGLSLDGDKNIHDARRKDKNQKGTFDKVMNGKKILDKYQVPYNTLTVVDNKVANNPKKTYDFFKNKKIRYTQYIPYLHPLKIKETPNNKDVLNIKNYETFLKDTFDEWYKDFMNGDYISIRYFDNLVSMILGGGNEACDMNGVCSIQNIVEADGSVYPCDFYVYEKWSLGNLNTDTFEEIFKSPKIKEFIKDSFEKNEKCEKCKWINLCRGGCKRYRENNNNLNILCEANKGFFEYAIDRLINVAKIVSQRR